MADSQIELTSSQYARLLNAAEEVIFVLDLDQRYMGIWGRWMDEHDLDPSEFLEKTSWEIFGEDARDEFESMNERVLTNGETVSWGRWFDMPWGAHLYYHTTLSPLRDSNGLIIGVVGVGRDITESVEARGRLEHLALHDPLTGLPNRAAFQNAAERATARARRGVDVALLFLDLDNFKSCNDKHGHATGDEVLAMIAQLLRQRVREPDIVARIGGDEFGIILDDADIEDARFKAEGLREMIRDFGLRFELDLDLSVGITLLKADTSFTSALQAADRAMYEAKGREDEQVVIAS